MTDTAITASARLDRALRLEELLLSTAAAPLAIEPIAPIDRPSDTDALPIQVDVSDARQQQMAQTPTLNESVQTDAVPVASDAIDASLQASLDAIHVSLSPDANTPDDRAAPPTDPALEASQPRHALGAHSAPIDSIASPHPSANTGGDLHAGAADSDALHVSLNAAPNLANITAPVVLHAAPVAGAIEGLPQTPIAIVGDVVTDAAQPVLDLLGGLDHDGLLHVDAPALVEEIVGVRALIDTVTVPSLDGAGVDTLSGLLPTSGGLASTLSLTANDAVSTVDHVVLSPPIGLEDSHHLDFSVSHIAHSLQHLPGSGLI